jgi:hypothetical protein
MLADILFPGASQLRDEPYVEVRAGEIPYREIACTPDK